jgi:hypothetical protein
MASRQVGVNPGNTRKSPRDMTGKLDEKQKAAAADELSLAAERLAMATEAAVVSNSEVIDMTAAGIRERAEAERKAAEPVGPAEVKPQVHRVRVLADIEDMVYGREVVDPGNYADPDFIVGETPLRMPTLGGLRFLNFQEGREYMVDHDLYLHLKSLDYIWD